MAQDASFHDASEQPLRLIAQDAEDLKVLSTLIQDAVVQVGDVAWLRGRRRVAIFLSRFRWEDKARAEKAGRAYERVRSALLVESVVAMRAAGVDPREKEQVLSILALRWEGAADPEDPSGILHVTLSGDGELAISVECLDLRLEDVTRPYAAISGKAPEHGA